MIGLKVAFIALTFITNLFLFGIGSKAIKKTSKNSSRDQVILAVTLILWQIYIFLIAESGVIQSFAFPPNFALLLILPSFLFTGVFLWTHRNKKWLHVIPQQRIIYFQSFRIAVELLFVWALAHEIFNKEVTIEGYNFDLVFALTVPFVGYFAFTKKRLSKSFLIFWNLLGLAVLASIIVVFMLCIYAPDIFDSAIPLLPLKSMTHPFVLIPGFLMPVAVFLHVLSIIQIRKGE